MIGGLLINEITKQLLGGSCIIKHDIFPRSPYYCRFLCYNLEKNHLLILFFTNYDTKCIATALFLNTLNKHFFITAKNHLMFILFKFVWIIFPSQCALSPRHFFTRFKTFQSVQLWQTVYATPSVHRRFLLIVKDHHSFFVYIIFRYLNDI